MKNVDFASVYAKKIPSAKRQDYIRRIIMLADHLTDGDVSLAATIVDSYKNGYFEKLNFADGTLSALDHYEKVSLEIGRFREFLVSKALRGMCHEFDATRITVDRAYPDGRTDTMAFGIDEMGLDILVSKDHVFWVTEYDDDGEPCLNGRTYSHLEYDTLFQDLFVNYHNVYSRAPISAESKYQEICSQLTEDVKEKNLVVLAAAEEIWRMLDKYPEPDCHAPDKPYRWWRHETELGTDYREDIRQIICTFGHKSFAQAQECKVITVNRFFVEMASCISKDDTIFKFNKQIVELANPGLFDKVSLFVSSGA